ncbi:UDP-N-acetylmuramate dehydrogenase [Aestuariirhabdus litorea]|uniref:UDP-N-acetylenolpyruvoylglucosamine reductase n=1 Tax=Aestuariirhabdus litorea TaxID=2528527 RepID=A0A3P3VQU2_9GAMM|nr:UDP-N-acetylmuramate dehydrogenase [Aestuariirhabdus litorea]RRJ84687.1 UDP-N-acetylmuramate dehydrogenase [Aestuariirhabdus litorea]RWW97912.1 UDP-N-acetylmuramate dehydrogenase [Endozoicomonadaceae bacterium GTF-13]
MIEHQVDLTTFNSLRLTSTASHYCRAGSNDALREAARFARGRGLPLILLGQGSNMVLPTQLDALVVQVALEGVQVTPTSRGAEITAAAGEGWDRLVARTVDLNLWGLENLSLIPGTVGAAPIQNIGAYGVEIKDRLKQLRVLDLASGEIETLGVDDCLFGYRDSIFKQAYRGRFAVIDCTFSLTSQASPQLEYGALSSLQTVADLSPLQVRESVCQLRREKLPDPAVVPNAGSFFKNPVLPEPKALELEAKFPDLVSFRLDGARKLAAGWMIEKAGFKGCQRGAVGVYPKQALVLTSDGTADADQLSLLVNEIQQKVDQLFGVRLEVEPQWYNEDGSLRQGF